MEKNLLTGEDLTARIRILARHRALQVLAELAADRHLQVYLVGGTVRELLLGREIHDLDLAVSRQTLDLARALAAALGGTFVLLDETGTLRPGGLAGSGPGPDGVPGPGSAG